MDPDDVAYKKSVRNMSLVLAAIVLTIFGALAYAYLNPVHNNFQASVSEPTGQDFTLHLNINSTTAGHYGSVNITAWAVSTSQSINNISSSDSWVVTPSKLWTRPCVSGFPIGVGVMQGHYDQSNYSLGKFLTPIIPLTFCPFPPGIPHWFALEPGTSNAIVSLNGTLGHWALSAGTTFNRNSARELVSSDFLPSGVYTVVAADEWGDVLTTNFVVS